MELKIEEISGHRQTTNVSCVPMSVECVLKLLKLMKLDDFSLQEDTKKSGTSDWVRGFKYYGTKSPVIFSREFLLKDEGINPDKGPHFMKNYFEPLFRRIDQELSLGRFVIISLKSGPMSTHNEVIFNKISDDEYQTLTFYHNVPDPAIHNHNLKERVRVMEGTDILTYKTTEV
jgi:hypothetical protein